MLSTCTPCTFGKNTLQEECCTQLKCIYSHPEMVHWISYRMRMDGLETMPHKNLKTICSRGSYFTSSIRNLHTATAQNNYIKPMGGVGGLNRWETLRHEPSDLSSPEQNRSWHSPGAGPRACFKNRLVLKTKTLPLSVCPCPLLKGMQKW